MSDYAIVNGELYHHGVKGMKWGKRKKYYGVGTGADLDRAKAAYKQAKKDYNKSFNKAYNRAAAAYSPFKKHRQANDKRWEDAAEKAETLNKAKKDYKLAKTQYKDFVKQRAKEINAGESFVGRMYNIYTGADKIQAQLEYYDR